MDALTLAVKSTPARDRGTPGLTYSYRVIIRVLLLYVLFLFFLPQYGVVLRHGHTNKDKRHRHCSQVCSLH